MYSKLVWLISNVVGVKAATNKREIENGHRCHNLQRDQIDIIEPYIDPHCSLMKKSDEPTNHETSARSSYSRRFATPPCDLCSDVSVAMIYAADGCTCLTNRYQRRCMQHMLKVQDTDQIEIVEDYTLRAWRLAEVLSLISSTARYDVLEIDALGPDAPDDPLGESTLVLRRSG